MISKIKFSNMLICLFRFKDPFYWSAWILIGKDVNINLIQIQHAMLDQTLNKTEKELEEESGKELLNPKNVLPIGKKYKL